MILFDLLMLQNEPSREDFNCRPRRLTATTIEVLTKEEVIELREMYENLSDTDFNSEKFDMSPLIKKLEENLLNLKDVLSKRTNAAKLWLQYMQYISIIKEFTRAERICDWKGLLAAMGKMLNLFAATGHINYAKSARVFLQKMAELETGYPWLTNSFQTKVSIVFAEQTSFGLDYGLT